MSETNFNLPARQQSRLELPTLKRVIIFFKYKDDINNERSTEIVTIATIEGSPEFIRKYENDTLDELRSEYPLCTFSANQNTEFGWNQSKDALIAEFGNEPFKKVLSVSENKS